MNTPSTRVRHHPSAPPAQPTAVFIDGSALFLALRGIAEPSARLNYRALIDVLMRRVPGLQAPSGRSGGPPWTMWTAAAQENPGQAAFLEFTEKQLHFDVRRFSPSQAFMIEPTTLYGFGGSESSKMGRLIRFDSAISFAIGRLTEDFRVVVISDSFALAEPLARVDEYYGSKNGKPVLAFFGRAIDSRWHVTLKDDHAPEFINLDEYESELFGVERKEVFRPALNPELKF
jgi:hypothetical protein